MNVTVKKASLIESLDILFNLEQDIFTESYHLRSPDKKIFLDWIRKSKIYLAYDGDKIIGFGAYEMKKHSAEITTLGVRKDYRNKKIGALIINKILSDLGSLPVELKTHPDNPAVNFYQKFGFKKGEIIQNYENLGQPRLILKRK